MKNDVIFPNQSEPVFSWSQVNVWVSWSDPQMCWWNAFNLICGIKLQIRFDLDQLNRGLIAAGETRPVFVFTVPVNLVYVKLWG